MSKHGVDTEKMSKSKKRLVISILGLFSSIILLGIGIYVVFNDDVVIAEPNDAGYYEIVFSSENKGEGTLSLNNEVALEIALACESFELWGHSSTPYTGPIAIVTGEVMHCRNPHVIENVMVSGKTPIQSGRPRSGHEINAVLSSEESFSLNYSRKLPTVVIVILIAAALAFVLLLIFPDMFKFKGSVTVDTR